MKKRLTLLYIEKQTIFDVIKRFSAKTLIPSLKRSKFRQNHNYHNPKNDIFFSRETQEKWLVTIT